jgi:ABC-type enterochelin transport system substrate-binding protein
VRDALKAAEPVKELQHQVDDALKHVGEIGDLRQQMQAAQKELNIQFQRIAQIQAQLDKLMAILTSPQPRREDT